MIGTGRLIRSGLHIVLAGGILLTMTACKQTGSSSSSAAEASSQIDALIQMPDLPENKTLITNPEASDFLIAENGTAKVTIVVPESPSDKVRAAAEDLQSVLNKMTGAVVKIGFDNVERREGNYILVGPTKQTKELGIEQPTGYPNAEKVILKRVKNYLVLIGNDDAVYQGTENAVTMLLEKLGCGWFGTDPLWEEIPSHPTLAVGKLDIEHTPRFRSRNTRVYSSYLALGSRWYLGGDQMMAGHALPGLVSRETQFEAHPEWFALVDGKRDPQSQEWWQYDYTNKELAAEIAKKVIQYFDTNPNMTNYSLAANDGWEEGWCECDVCKAVGNPTDQLLYFANNVAEIVGKVYPEKLLTILSYHNNYFPPEKVKAHPNVEVMFCRETSLTIPLDLNEAIVGRDTITHNTYTQSWLGNFQQYIRDAGVRHTSIWEWYCIAAEREVWASVPFVQGNVATRNQALWEQNGVEYVFYDQGPAASYRETEQSFSLRWPLWYVASKGMWDGSLSGEQILYDACRKLYGAAADEMFTYYKALADSSEQCRAYSMTWIPPKPSEMYPQERVDVINAAIKAAEAKLDSVTDTQKQRMEDQIAIWKKASLLIKYN